MNSITWLLHHFGFTYRELADVLNLSPAMLHQAQNNSWNLPKKSAEILQHPLFQFPDAKEIPAGPVKAAFNSNSILSDLSFPPGIPDPSAHERTDRWNFLLKGTGLKIHKLQSDLFRMEKRVGFLQARIFHTENLNRFETEGISGYVVNWWTFQRSAAQQELEKSFSREKWEKAFLRLALLETEAAVAGKFVE